ncbi:MAG: hypothetical protein NVSMB70_14500 [Chamaesiphon sp.]
MSFFYYLIKSGSGINIFARTLTFFGTVLDVRGDDEFKNGNVPGAKHIYVPHLEEHLDELDKNQTIATYCGSGYRASIAASLLQKHGFEKVVNVPGSWNAWTAAKLPVQHLQQAELATA